MMDRLLVIACSEKKRTDRSRLAAIDRYDGPTFRVLRRYIRENGKENLDVYVLSARYGLISSQKQIANYNFEMTHRRAAQLSKEVGHAVKAIIESNSWTDIGLCLGRNYLACLGDIEDFVTAGVTVTTLNGGLGSRLTILRNWLWENANGK